MTIERTNFAFLVAVFALLQATNSLKPSMYNPPWKHCVHQLHPEKVWKEFASPGFPHGIKTQTQCSWIIVVPNPNLRIRLAFDTLNLTGSINYCFTQYIEFWEMNSASNMGKFCGDQRPGDYVSYGNAVRVDLKADTADEGHVGFLMKYKITRDKGGYRKEYSFPKLPPGVSEESDEKETSSKSPPKSKKPPPTGGRINLSYLKKRRLEAAKKNNGNAADNAKVAINRIPSPPPSTKPWLFRKQNDKKDELIIVDDKQPSGLGFELWIMILIGVGAFLFLVFLCVLVWLCFCRKKKQKPSFDSLTNRKDGTHENKNAISRNHTTQSNYQQQLPGYYSHENQFVPLENYPGYSFQSPLHPMPNNPDFNGQFYPNGFGYHHNVGNFNVGGSDGMKHNSLSYTNTFPLEGTGDTKVQRSQTVKEKRKPVPTLKRKFSAWEKEQIKKGTLKR